MATFLKTKVVNNIGTTPVDVIQTVENNRYTIIGCNVANITEDNVTLDIFVVDGTSTAGYYVKGIIIPPNNSLKVVTNGEKLVLGPQCGLRMQADVDASLDIVISYVEIV